MMNVRAEAFADLDEPIHSLWEATLLLERVTTDILSPARARDVREGTQTYYLHEQETAILFHAMHHVGNLARDLQKQWTAAAGLRDPEEAA